MHTEKSLVAGLKSWRNADPQDVTAAACRAEIIRALSRLPYQQKAVIYEFYMSGTQWERIAAQMGCSVTQCKNIRNKALDTLLCHLNEKAS